MCLEMHQKNIIQRRKKIKNSLGSENIKELPWSSEYYQNS